jgi:hypothetical protein
LLKIDVLERKYQQFVENTNHFEYYFKINNTKFDINVEISMKNQPVLNGK